MTIVIVVTIAFFVLTLAGTILSRRSAYRWADAEQLRRDNPGVGLAARGQSSVSEPPTPAEAPRGPLSPTAPTPHGSRAPHPSDRIVIRGFDSPSR